MNMTLEQTPEALRGLAKVIREHGTCAAIALEHVADAIDAHLARQSEGVSDEDVPKESEEHLLRAMARNYGNGPHSWDKLDKEACLRAADEIRTLRAALTAIWHNRPAQEKCSACDDTGRVESTDGGVWGSCYKCGKRMSL